MNNNCTFRYDTLTTVELHIFATFFITVSVVSSVLNLFSFKLMYTAINSSGSSSTISNRLALISLALTGCVSGLVISPISAVQMMSISARMSCTLDTIRGYFSVMMLGNSAFTISLIAYERYVLLKRNRSMKKKKIYILVALAWAIPILLPVTRFISEGLYFITISFGVLLPYAALSVSYYYIMKAVRLQETKLLLHYFQRDFMDSTSARKIKVKKKKLKKHLKVAKTVAILIIAYFVCSAPIIMWFIMELINKRYNVAPVGTRQCFYASAMLLGCANSCMNPPIYFGKIPEFQKELNSLFFKKRSVKDINENNLHQNLAAVKSNASMLTLT